VSIKHTLISLNQTHTHTHTHTYMKVAHTDDAKHNHNLRLWAIAPCNTLQLMLQSTHTHTHTHIHTSLHQTHTHAYKHTRRPLPPSLELLALHTAAVVDQLAHLHSPPAHRQHISQKQPPHTLHSPIENGGQHQHTHQHSSSSQGNCPQRHAYQHSTHTHQHNPSSQDEGPQQNAHQHSQHTHQHNPSSQDQGPHQRAHQHSSHTHGQHSSPEHCPHTQHPPNQSSSSAPATPTLTQHPPNQSSSLAHSGPTPHRGPNCCAREMVGGPSVQNDVRKGHQSYCPDAALVNYYYEGESARESFCVLLPLSVPEADLLWSITTTRVSLGGIASACSFRCVFLRLIALVDHYYKGESARESFCVLLPLSVPEADCSGQSLLRG